MFLKEQFHTVDKDIKLKNSKTKEEAIRHNTYFTAIRKDNYVTGALNSGVCFFLQYTNSMDSILPVNAN